METHLIAYARAKNAYDYVMSCQVRKMDLMDVVGDLSQKNRRNDARVPVETRVGHDFDPSSSSGGSGGSSSERGVTKRAVSATSSSSNGHNSDMGTDDQHPDKKHRPGSEGPVSGMSQDKEVNIQVTESTADSFSWREGVDWIGQNYGYRPGDSLIPHIPLQQVCHDSMHD